MQEESGFRAVLGCDILLSKSHTFTENGEKSMISWYFCKKSQRLWSERRGIM